MARYALFLDRDGVINVDRGYVCRREDFEWVEGVFDTVRCARDLGMEVVIVTNQAGIGRGYYSEQQYQALTSWMVGEFAAHAAPISGVYHCPYHAEGKGEYRVADHPDRKPRPGMLRRAASDLGLDLAASALLGDKESDIDAALAAGLGDSALFAPAGVAGSTRARSIVRSHAEAQDWLVAHSQYLRTRGFQS